MACFRPIHSFIRSVREKMVLSMGKFLGIHTCLMLLNMLAVFGNVDESDISCLRSIKDSIRDPFGYLTSWNFNQTGTEDICGFRGVQCWHADENRVLAIQLVDMGLEGQFPPGIEYCTSLIHLDLSRNHLSGPIPADISHKLNYVTLLDLSFNHFSGTIPSEIAICQYLNTLKLNNNQLWGPIPTQIALLPRLKVFDVSHNGLTGKIPNLGNAYFLYDDNPGLCGDPSSPCKSGGHPFVEAFFKGFGIGWAISFTLYICLPKVISMWRRKNGTNKDGVGGSQVTEPTMMLEVEKYVTRISFQELVDLTSNFCHESVIGFGKNGIMYKALTPNGCSLAIKKLYALRNSDNKFVSEVLSLGLQRHPNLLPLMGFCIEKDERFLIYKYMQNGTLHDCLHQSTSMIEWPLRMKISIGVANGLAWLHHTSKIRILHCNINSFCILLDHNFEPKISNFWDAKFMNQAGVGLSKSLMSSLESSAPLDCPNAMDVYCFGLVLLELITGKEWDDADLEDEELPNCMVGRGFDEVIAQFYQVAKDCVNPKREQRPTMLQVCKRLEEIKWAFENAGHCEISILTDEH